MEEVVTHHRQRALKQRREVFGVHLQKRKEALAFCAFERLGAACCCPATKDLAHSSFRFALSEFLGRVIRRTRKRKRTIIFALGHVGNDSLSLLILRRTQHRHDSFERPVVERTLIVKLKRAD